MHHYPWQISVKSEHFGLNFGFGIDRDLGALLADGSQPLRAVLAYRGEYARNFLDEEILSDSNAVLDKRQIIFRSSETDKR